MYDELVKRLRLCAEGFNCARCEYEFTIGCRAKLNNDAADAIEELGARLEAHNEWFAKADKKIEEYKAAYIAEHDARIAEVSKAPRWIPVTERLPDKPGIYAVWTAKGFGNHLSTSYFDGDSWSLRITHWMPLPEPPKEET